ncbi:adenosylmethionine decarboxylase [Methylogaea oryzae]|uniref:S-adenosylmethionine decarboxylase proenzyme n=1 Tax=Methylogaea oryzae TaxID=1295382 RepID=A0A8D4VLP8_9GAMM|nr:adenosylmethionine decarboxylase [Methylogaea oryzae]BBL70115.1 hypothetical protein MoryE10_07210 [Methylogaea oryzae]
MHMILELYDCEAGQFDDVQWVEQVMVGAAKAANATIISVSFNKFNPIGISGVVVISESHLTIHTWPEYKYAAIDIFTCGDVLDGDAAVNYLKTAFESDRIDVRRLDRGQI